MVPPFITMIWSDTASASSWSCVTYNTVNLLNSRISSERAAQLRIEVRRFVEEQYGRFQHHDRATATRCCCRRKPDGSRASKSAEHLELFTRHVAPWLSMCIDSGHNDISDRHVRKQCVTGTPC
jgi:hypothetical protein